MVLRALLLISTVIPSLATAAVKKVQVKQSGCPMLYIDRAKNKFVGVNRRFKKGTQVNLRSASGMKVAGTKIPQNSDFYIIQDPKSSKTFFLGEGKCLLTAKAPPPRQPPQQATENSANKNSGGFVLSSAKSNTVQYFDLESEWKYAITLFAQTYRSQLKISFPDTQTANIDTQIISILPEFDIFRSTIRDQWGLSIGAFYGYAEAGQSLSESLNPSLAGYEYQAENIPVLGIETSFSYLYRPQSKNVAFGLKIPIRWTKASWPVPGENYSVEPQSGLSISYLLENRVERDSVTWVQNIGFYQKWGRVIWSLGLSYRL